MSVNAWGSDAPAEVAKGGTGNATLTDGGVLLGSGTGAVTLTAQPTNGQLLIGSTSADPVLAVPAGTANEVGIATGGGTLTIGIADDPVLPGSASVTIPAGNTAAEPAATNGMLRYDSDTNKIRGVVGGSWADVSTGGGGGGGWTLLDVSVASADSEITWDNTIITSTYSNYVQVVIMSWSTTDIPALQLSDDNGVSYYDGTEYRGGIAYWPIRLTSGTTATGYWTHIGYWNLGSSFDMSYMVADGGRGSSSSLKMVGDFDPSATVTINAMRMYCVSGATLTGTVWTYGLAKT